MLHSASGTEFALYCTGGRVTGLGTRLVQVLCHQPHGALYTGEGHMAHIGATGWCVLFSRRLKWVGWLSVCGCAHSVHVLNPACWLGAWSSSTRLQNHPPRRHTHPRVRGSLCSGYALSLFHCKDDAGGHGMCSWHLTSSFLCVSY